MYKVKFYLLSVLYAILVLLCINAITLPIFDSDNFFAFMIVVFSTFNYFAAINTLKKEG